LDQGATDRNTQDEVLAKSSTFESLLDDIITSSPLREKVDHASGWASWRVSSPLLPTHSLVMLQAHALVLVYSYYTALEVFSDLVIR